jgi:Flp pilus assembly protein TadG
MVTLALLAMAGMMGLAVDLGWSFYVKKSAQSAADSAALAAVQEAFRRNGGGTGTLTCGSTADCKPITPCSSITAPSNLYNGCAYAAANGFTSGVGGSHQEVTIRADVTTPPPTVPGVTNVKYWVTVSAMQTIPQLFSSVLGNTQGTVAAIATAAIAGSTAPGSFYGMNHEGDCLTGLTGTVKPAFNCGVDIDLSGTGTNNPCMKMDGTSSGFNAKLCAPAGIFLSSQCKGPGSVAGCTDPGSGSANFAGQTTNNPTVWSQGGTQIRNDGWVGLNGTFDASATNWLPHPPGVVNSPSDFSDPTGPLKQPSLVNPSQPACAVTNGVIPAGATVGPYQYYAVNSGGTATGAPVAITVSGSNKVTFDPGSTACPGTVFPTGATPDTGTFRTFTFWGGMDITANGNNSAVNFGAGQYVMAGVNSTTPTAPVFKVDGGGTLHGDPVIGTQFLFTDQNYSAQGTSLTKPAALSGTTFNQGFTYFKNATGDLTALTSAAPTLTDYKNFLFWQDRRNSNDTINPTDGSFISFAHPLDRTDTSPQFVMASGALGLNLRGVLYQPRGAWAHLESGGAGAAGNTTLMMVTGALTCGTGCGNASVTLLGPTSPIVVFVATLIQ